MTKLSLRPIWEKIKFVAQATLFWGILYGAFFGFFFLLHYWTGPRDERSKDDLETAEVCQNWRFESRVERYMDGPEIQKLCTYYLAHRTDKERQYDDARWEAKLEEARKQWTAPAPELSPE